MAYTKQYFEDGQVVFAEHLNHIEDGIYDNAEQIDALTIDVNALKRSGGGSSSSGGGSGVAGEDGGYYTPSVNSNGTLSWTPSKEDMPSVPSVNIKGPAGATGATGADGKTPVKGTDYFTEADKTEMVALVLASLPTWTGGSY